MRANTKAFYERFTFEPRAKSAGFRSTSSTWLVCYDNLKQTYVSEGEGRHKTRKTFYDSTQGYQWLAKNYNLEVE